MYKTIQKSWPHDGDLPERAYSITMLKRVLNGEMYDNLPHPFHCERSDAGEYVPLRDRRPSVRTNLCRTVVDDSVALLFGEDHFPIIEIGEKEQKKALNRLLKEIKFNETMIDAATRGSVGSVAIMFQVLKDRVFLKVLDTDTLTPTWDPEAPDTLIKVTEKYKVLGRALRDSGYTIPDDDMQATFWFQREWDCVAENWFTPWKVADNQTTTPVIDAEKTTQHSLGFVPIAWVKNLPGGDSIDGKPTFQAEAIDCQIEIDYQLSQAGRGLKFMSDPMLVLMQAQDPNQEALIKGSDNAIVVGESGNAKYLEIDGTGVAAVIDYVKHLREIALENMHGNKASNEKIAAAQSGRAMELMNQALIWLADKLSISYGEGAIIDIASMIIRASLQTKLKFKDGTKVGEFTTKTPPLLRWPSWYTPTMQDLVNRASALKTLCDAGLLSRETAIKILASEYDIEDALAEKALADADMVARNSAAKITANIAE